MAHIHDTSKPSLPRLSSNTHPPLDREQRLLALIRQLKAEGVDANTAAAVAERFLAEEPR